MDPSGGVSCTIATNEDSKWILDCMIAKWDELIAAASRNLRPHRWIPSAEELHSAIAAQLVLVAYIDKVKVGYLIFMEHDQSFFGTGYGSWFNPFLYIRDVYTVPAYRRRGVFRRLHEQVESIARSRNITELITHAYCNVAHQLEIPESVGFSRRVGIFAQSLQEYYKVSFPAIQSKYAARWANWTTRDASEAAGEAHYLVQGLADIYTLEGYADKTEDMSEELENAKLFVREGRAIIAVDRTTNERLGLLTFAIGKSFPYGCEEFGPFPSKYLWCSYIWIEPKMRSSGVARFLYHELFERAKAAGADFVGLDVFNENSSSWSFHHQALNFQPEIQLFSKILK